MMKIRIQTKQQYWLRIEPTATTQITLGDVVVMILWQLNLQLPAQSVLITTNIVRSTPVHGEVYSIQHYVVKFVSNAWHVGSFLLVLRFPPPIKQPSQTNPLLNHISKQINNDTIQWNSRPIEVGYRHMVLATLAETIKQSSMS